jgi:hypothetical protein
MTFAFADASAAPEECRVKYCARQLVTLSTLILTPDMPDALRGAAASEKRDLLCRIRAHAADATRIAVYRECRRIVDELR